MPKDKRAEFQRCMDEAFNRFGADNAELDAASVMQWGVGYFADLYARHFGQAAAVKMLTETARKGVEGAAAEIAGTRH